MELVTPSGVTTNSTRTLECFHHQGDDPSWCSCHAHSSIIGTLFGVETLSGVLAGSLVYGVQIAISASNTGGAGDNAKKHIESMPESLARKDQIPTRLLLLVTPLVILLRTHLNRRHSTSSSSSWLFNLSCSLHSLRLTGAPLQDLRWEDMTIY